MDLGSDQGICFVGTAGAGAGAAVGVGTGGADK